MMIGRPSKTPANFEAELSVWRTFPLASHGETISNECRDGACRSITHIWIVFAAWH
jgi:hypothetical protein